MKRSKLDKLDKELKAWLEKRIVDNHFSDYSGMTQELNAKLEEYGFSVSRSALHSHGKRIQDKLEAVRDATAAAKIIEEQARDEGDALGGAVIGMIKSEMFNSLVDLQTLAKEDDPTERILLLNKLASGAADINRAGIGQKKYNAQVREKMDAALKKLETEAAVKTRGKSGLDPATLARVRQELYGI